MPATKHIAEFDIVELADPIDKAPAGSRGGVLDIFDDGTAMVEIISLPGEMDIDRIVVAPLGKLRVVDPAPHA
jgi:hypothetical protein